MFSNVWLADDEDEKRHGHRPLDGIPQNAAARSVRVGFLEKAHWISSICSVFVLVDAGRLRNSQGLDLSDSSLGLLKTYLNAK